MRALLLCAAHVAAAALLLAAGASAQDHSLHASIRPDSVSLGDLAVFELSLRSPTENIPSFIWTPSLPDFEVRSRPQVSTKMMMSGNQVTYQRTLSWAVSPRSEGVLQIPPVTIEIGGLRVTSNAVRLNVMPSPLHDLLEGEPLAPPVWAVPNRRGLPEATHQMHSQIFREHLYLLVCADRPEPFVGEQVNISTYLINRPNSGILTPLERPIFQPRNSSPLQTGSMPAVDLVAAKVPPRGLFDGVRNLAETDYLETTDPISGEPAHVILLHRMALWPTEAGEISLGQVEARSRYLFVSRGRQRANDLELVTAPVTLNVRSLPGAAGNTASVPVGRDLRLSVSLTPTELAFDEAATLEIRVEGVVFPDWIDAPEIDEGNLFSAEPPPTAPQPERWIRGDRIVGSRVFDYLVRFDRGRTGDLTLPPIRYPVFDLDREEFVDLTGIPIEVTVSSQPSEPLQEITPTLRVAHRARHQEVSEDFLLEIETTGFRGLTAPPPLATQTTAGWILIVAPGVILLGALAVNRRRARLRGAEGFALRTRRRAAHHLRRAQRARSRGETEVFHAELASAVHGHLTQRLGTTTFGSSWPEIDAALADRGVEDGLRRRLADALEQSDFARFAPGVDASAAMDQLFDQTVAALRELERRLPARRGDGR